MKTRLKRFQRLAWKLTLSYTLVTVTAVLVLEVLGLLLLFLVATRTPVVETLVEQLVIQIAEQAPTMLAQGETDPEALQSWLAESFPPAGEGSQLLQFRVGPEDENEQVQFSPDDHDLVAITGPAGEMVATNYPGEVLSIQPGSPFSDPLAQAESSALLTSALQGETVTQSVRGFGTLGAAPIRGQDNRPVGAVYVRFVSLTPVLSGVFVLEILRVLGVSALIFTIGAGAVGTLFGFFTARGISRRLQRVSTAADSWSRGNFSVFVQDHSGDELGDLAQRLNRMAEQLQNLLQTRHELATLEERNRLARDLHDSVKQQVFATVMQVGAAKALVDRDPQAAAAHLQEAEDLSRQVQAELAGLISQLRPASLEGRGLVDALRAYAEDWSRQNEIQASVSTQGERQLSLEVEQALFRVVQEALANVARHSAATQVNIHLAWQGSQLNMTIADNGRGFDLEKASGQGVGLGSMRERVEALGGTLEFASAPGRGTRLEISVDTAAVPAES